MVDGRRKSGRTNIIPLEMQPQSNKRQTRAAFDKAKVDHQKNAKPVYKINVAAKKEVVGPTRSPTMVKRTPVAPAKSHDAAPQAHLAKIESLQRQIRQLENTRSKSSRKPHSKSPKSLRRTVTAASRPPAKSPKMNGFHEKNPHTNGVVKFESDSDSDDLSTALSDSELSFRAPTPPLILRKVTFRVHLQPPLVATPANLPPPKKFASFEEFLEQDETESGPTEDTLTPQQVRREAMVRTRVRAAQKRGGALDKKLLDTLPKQQTEPKRQYAHHDHLLAHVVYFGKLLETERKDHMRKAQILAHEAKRYVEEQQKRNKVKSADEIELEMRAACLVAYRSVVKDVDKLWTAVRTEVEAMRRQEYEDQQQAEMKGHLARVLDRTDQMLSRAAEEEDEITDSATDLSDDELTASESENSEQMSDSQTDSESEPDAQDADVDMSLEELQKKYGDLPALPVEHSDDDEPPKADAAEVEGESDPETEMDSEFDSEESEDEVDADEEEEESDEDEAGPDLLSMLFSTKRRAEIERDRNEDDIHDNGESENHSTALVEEIQDEPMANTERSEEPIAQDTTDQRELNVAEHTPDKTEAVATHHGEDAEMQDANSPAHLTIPHLASEEPASADLSPHTSPHTTATKVSDPDSVSSIDAQIDPTPVTPSDTKPAVETPVPSLLRGTLREYQHEGLDWLANLYAKGRSGILADEMGLGKTIQSIALLAHLAEVYEVWGPHLIVVPTSVMLNWEMEFKKFLPGFKIMTYYGDIAERKAKRQGWLSEDKFNVCITSYQLVLKDKDAFKRRKWHYMILDEAHNIKNFRSERWQTMMTFNTRARLLLTGTPLQNNLTELWSLLFFLHYGQEDQGEDDAFAGLKEWSEWFKRPVESILEHGRQVLDDEDREQVAKLHKVIRPFLLRRLKADVEKQMPGKYEHVEMCRLSKRNGNYTTASCREHKRRRLWPRATTCQSSTH